MTVSFWVVSFNFSLTSVSSLLQAPSFLVSSRLFAAASISAALSLLLIISSDSSFSLSDCVCVVILPHSLSIERASTIMETCLLKGFFFSSLICRPAMCSAVCIFSVSAFRRSHRCSISISAVTTFRSGTTYPVPTHQGHSTWPFDVSITSART